MQGEVSLLVNRQWLGRIWYLRGADLGLVIDIASRLRAQIFAPLEFCPSGAMYIISRGMALWGARLRRAGGVCGDDVLLQNVELQLSFSAVAATYLWVFSMSGNQLHKALANFPVCAASMLSIARRWAIRRAVVRQAERECYARGYNFRGRLFPIYAKELVTKIEMSRVPRLSTIRANRPKPTLRANSKRSLVGMSQHFVRRRSSQDMDIRSVTATDGNGPPTAPSSKPPLTSVPAADERPVKQSEEKRVSTDSRVTPHDDQDPAEFVKPTGEAVQLAAAQFGLRLREHSSEITIDHVIEAQRESTTVSKALLEEVMQLKAEIAARSEERKQSELLVAELQQLKDDMRTLLATQLNSTQLNSTQLS